MMSSGLLLLALFSIEYVSAAAAAAVADTSSLNELISQLVYKNKGTVTNKQTFSMQSISSIYNEGYTYMGQGEADFQVGGHLSYLFEVTNASTHSNKSTIQNNTDFPGDDYFHFSNCSDYETCSNRCENDAKCKAWVFDGNAKGCWLKSAVPARVAKQGDVSGCKDGVFEINCGNWNGSLATPPSGMRSAVPMGSLGGGSIELRADGRLSDWTIFNNEPEEIDGKKIDVDEAAFGLFVDDGGGDTTSCSMLLRTHPPSPLPSVESLTYEGAFPTARLTVNDSRLSAVGIDVRLTAFSSFEMHNVNASITPAIVFFFDISSSKSRNVSLWFNLPDVIGANLFGPSESGNGVTMTKSGTASNSGSLTMQALCSAAENVCSWQVSESFESNWKSFVENGGKLSNKGATSRPNQHGSVAWSGSMQANENVSVVFVLAWYFPHRHWSNTDIGNYYSLFFDSVDDVVSSVVHNASHSLQSILNWQKLVFSPSYPEFLQDSLINSPTPFYKSAMFLRDGRWRQFESRSCSQMEPPHIHFYRAFAYWTLFPSLERQTVQLYADAQLPDGLISEQFGGGCGGASGKFDLDKPNGDPRGDDNGVFILDVFMNYLWTIDGEEFAAKVWPQVELATRWQLAHASNYGLTSDLVNTNDEHGTIGDVNAYDAFVYLASLAAARNLSQSNQTFVDEIEKALKLGVEKLDELLWTGTHYRSFWCKNGKYSANALQGDSLYGQMWAMMVGLDTGVNVTRLKSHVQTEKAWNWTPYGIQFCTNRTTDYHCGKGIDNLGVGFEDFDTWEAHSFDHAFLRLTLFQNTSSLDALEAARLVADKYRLIVNDQWDYRDLSSIYDDASPIKIRPVCNSHYSRQLIMWNLPVALSGQIYDARRETLSFNPRPRVANQWAFFTPSGNGIIRKRKEDGAYVIQLLSGGSMQLSSITIHGQKFSNGMIKIKEGENYVLEKKKDEESRL